MTLQVNLSDANGIQAITATFGPVVFVNIPDIPTLMATWIGMLPLELPATPGLPWNNGGTVSIS